MMENKKKKIAIGIAFLFLSAGVLAARPIADTETIEDQIDIHIAKEDVGHEGNVHYIFALKSDGDNKNNNTLPIFEFELSKEESKEMEQKISVVDHKIENSTTQKGFEENLEEKIDILRSYGCLPSFFSLENLTQLVYEISNSINQNKNSDYSTTQVPLFQSGLPYVGIGPGVFAYVSPLGTTTPFGLWNMTHWRAVGVMYQTNVTINYSGIYITSNSPLIKNRYIEINGPIWKSMWELLGEDGWVNFTEMNAYGIYMIEALIGHAISYSIAWSPFPNPKPRIMIGSFYYFGGPTIPLSFTLYKTHPVPWTTVLDIGIVFSLLGQIIFPFWYENN
jgi:hypothetical protein